MLFLYIYYTFNSGKPGFDLNIEKRCDNLILMPALSIEPGDCVLLETTDCFSDQIQDPQDRVEEISFDRVNPATGPIFVKVPKKAML